MTLLWANPYSWETGDPVTADQMNAVNNNLRYVFAPPRKVVTIRASGVSPTTASTTFVAIDDATYKINLEFQGSRDIRLKLIGAVSNATLGSLHNIDVKIDNSIYASSLTATPLTNGLWAASQHVSGYIIPVSLDVIVPIASLAYQAGFHYFTPMYKTSAGTLTWYEAAGIFSSFEVSEVQ